MSVVEEDFLEKFSKQGSTQFHSFQNMFFKWANPLSILIGRLRPLFRLFRLFKQIYGKNVHPVTVTGFH